MNTIYVGTAYLSNYSEMVQYTALDIITVKKNILTLLQSYVEDNYPNKKYKFSHPNSVTFILEEDESHYDNLINKIKKFLLEQGEDYISILISEIDTDIFNNKILNISKNDL